MSNSTLASEAEPTSSSAQQRDHFFSGIVFSISDVPTFPAPTDDLHEVNRDGLGCLRGIQVAFAFEAATALIIYGIWHLWHIVR